MTALQSKSVLWLTETNCLFWEISIHSSSRCWKNEQKQSKAPRVVLRYRSVYFQGPLCHWTSWHQLDLLCTAIQICTTWTTHAPIIVQTVIPTIHLYTVTNLALVCRRNHQVHASKPRINISTIYQGVKQSTGPRKKTCYVIKALDSMVLEKKEDHLSHWVEHFRALYSHNRCRPWSHRQDGRARLNLKEVELTVSAVKAGRAPGTDGIPAGVFKAGERDMTNLFLQLAWLCFNSGIVPQDLRESEIVTLYKNKGECSNCDNYRGISLLCMAGKVITRIALRRLQLLAECLYPESQWVFCSGRSTIDMVFTLRQIQEKCREQQMPLYIIGLISMEQLFQAICKELHGL